ncbi:MAG: sigma-70 family RNA polymerase sigma factor [Dokdonella sp.]
MPSLPNETATRFEIARWVRDARSGSQAAHARLFERFAPLVHGILLGRFRPAIADELTQECFETAFARLRQLKENDKFGPWIATIARRMRHGSLLPEEDHRELEFHLSAESSPETSTEAERMLRIIVSLPEAYRETLMLRLVEGMSGPEIAALTGLTPDSVRVNLHRGMQKLRVAAGIDSQPALAE